MFLDLIDQKAAASRGKRPDVSAQEVGYGSACEPADRSERLAELTDGSACEPEILPKLGGLG